MEFKDIRRVQSDIYDWPFGHNGRCVARFEIEQQPRKGERVSRMTSKKNGHGWNKPKKTVYAQKFVFATGDDDRIYLLSLCMYSDEAVIIWPGTMTTTTRVNDKELRQRIIDCK